jgi:Tol biopolymer transport system component/predicted Ser/Thr protein kinase
MSLTSGTRLGPYEILDLIGAGGMGEVYRARDTRLDRIVALKVSKDQFSERFEREARSVAALNHPNICTLHDVGPNYLVMEFVEGEMLSGPLPLGTAIGYARQMAEAIEAAHDKGIVHRDLKPANIKIKPDGAVKVLDFGLAKALEEETPSGSMQNSPTLTIGATKAGMILGTAAYMSPEQAKGKAADRRADIWAFGVVFYEMLTGKQLFTGETVGEILASVIKEEPALDGLPAAVRPLIARCLQKDPRRRLQAIGEARLMLEDGGTEVPRQAKARPTTLAWVLAAVGIIAAAAVSFVHFREPAPEKHAIRFQVSPPEKSNFNGYRLSPDGRNLAFIAGGGGPGRLMVRSMDSLEARAFPGTDGASLPFWSADSAWIGFFVQSENKLKKVSANGGPPQTLCDAPGRAGGTWNQDGVILFASGGAIQRVPQAGGVATPVTKPASGEQNVLPEFFPDGRHFLYWSRGSKPESNGIYAGSLDGGPPVRLLPDASNAAYVPPAESGASGHIIFRREDTLMAQPFDADKLQLKGEMFPVAEHVGQSGPQGNGAFSVSSNGVLVYGTGGAATTQELVWMDRTGKASGPAVPPGQYGNLRLSPDEKSVVFDRVESNNQDIWVRDLPRGVTSRLTFDPAADNFPIWSPDGQRVLWPSRRSGSFDLYIKNAAGTGQEELLIKMGSPNGWGTDWSRDGKFVMYMMPGEKTAQDLWIAPQSGDKKPFAYLQQPYNEFDGVFSPDGHWVAYVSNETGRNEVFVQAFPVSGAKWQISQAGGVDPQWRKDGSELFFVAAGGTLMVVPVKAGGTFVPGTPTALFPIVGVQIRRNYAASADGKRFLVARPVGEVAAAPITVVVNWREGLKK